MTESPRRKSLGMKRSLLTGFEPFFPRPVFGICATPATLRARTGGLRVCVISAGTLLV